MDEVNDKEYARAIQGMEIAVLNLVSTRVILDIMGLKDEANVIEDARQAIKRTYIELERVS